MVTEAFKAYADEAIVHTYNRFPVVFHHGDGVYLYDTEGKKYLDFMSGIAVFALGYGNAAFNDALKDQVDKLIHTSNYFYNVPAINAANAMNFVFICNLIFVVL